jgi:myo-inositol 2-dehydrogenase / D-chiro-inositol 1-dehydrogenase
MAGVVRLGIIGCGGVTEGLHLPALQRARDIRVVALADQDPVRLERLVREYRVPERYPTYAELIQASDVDAIAVCLPPQLHAEVALAALGQGKHLFIEKPLALNLADCDRLIEASKRDPSRKVMVGFNLRWHRLVRQTREILKRGELGPVRLARTVFTTGKHSGAMAGSWRASSETGGGVIFDLGVHHFDVVRFLLDSEVEEVHASSFGFDQAATVSFSMRNGAQITCAFAEGTGENQALEIYGERGWLRVCCYRSDGLEQFALKEYSGAIASRLRAAGKFLSSWPRALSRSRGGGEVAASYVTQWNHFAEAVLLNKAVEADLVAGRRALEIALAASTAIATGRACRPEGNG